MTDHVLRVIVAERDYDLAIDRLWLGDPIAVSEERAPGGIALIAAYRSRELAAEAAAALAEHGDVALTDPQPEDWVSTWRVGVTPIRVADLRISLPEHTVTPVEGVIDIVIEPDATFGYGHVSTRLMVAAMDSAALGGATVADIGTGSGILAVAASCLGAQTVWGVDTDPLAVRIALENAARNSTAGVRIKRGSARDLAPASADVILANMTAGTLRAVAGDIGRVGHDGSLVILSGLLDHQVSSVLDAFDGCELHQRTDEHGWSLLKLSMTR